MALRTDLIRELNRVILFTNPYNGKPIEPIFWAYTNKGVDVSYTNNVKDFMSGLQKSLFSTNLGALIGTSFGVTGQIDVERKYLMNGTEPLQFNLDCYLLLRDSYDLDIARPLQKLLDFVLPRRSNEDLKKKLVDGISNWCQSRGNLKGKFAIGSKNPTQDGNLWDKLQYFVESGNQWLGECYSILPPKQLMHSSITGKDEKNPSLSLIVGNQRFEDVFVESVSVNFPKLTVVDALGGVPEFINVRLKVSTLRGATTAMANFDRGVAEGIKKVTQKLGK